VKRPLRPRVDSRSETGSPSGLGPSVPPREGAGAGGGVSSRRRTSRRAWGADAGRGESDEESTTGSASASGAFRRSSNRSGGIGDQIREGFVIWRVDTRGASRQGAENAARLVNDFLRASMTGTPGWSGRQLLTIHDVKAFIRDAGGSLRYRLNASSSLPTAAW
jgi:hypothetical protein